MNNKWALILGGSNGLGLATAKKLGKHGYHIIVVHRDRRSETEAIELQFDEIRGSGVQVKSFNADALNPDKQKELTTRNSSSITGKP